VDGPAAPAEAWPGWTELLRVLAFQGGYNTSLVLLGVTLLGAAAGTVGSFALLRRRALMSDVLSHASLPGLCLAFLAAVALGASGRSLPVLLAGAAATGILGVLAVQALSARLPEDAAMGAVLSTFFGAGFVLLSFIQNLGTGEEGGLAKFIYGQTAAMAVPDALAILLVALGAVAVTALLFKEFRLACFDPDFAQAQGFAVGRIDLALMALVVAVTVVGLRAVGLILSIALLIIPAAAARFWSERLWVVTLLAALFGALSGYLGAAASALLPRFPAGGVIVLVAGAVFVLSLLLAPARGVLATAVRHARLRLRIASQHLLRAALEAGERTGDGPAAPVPLAELRLHRRFGRAFLALVLASLRLRGLAARAEGGAVLLTEAGRREALRVTRNHRLWERFLVDHAELAPSHVDHSADLVEHVLSPAMVAELERQLAAAAAAEGSAARQQRHVGLPPSVHPLSEGSAA
jgi:manganese/zinc/iron transport system permease protein